MKVHLHIELIQVPNFDCLCRGIQCSHHLITNFNHDNPDLNLQAIQNNYLNSYFYRHDC